MIITRSPLRITLGGGGTDLPSYYQKHGGFLIAAAIDKYVYINLHEKFEHGIILKYSEMERVATVNEVRHPIVREALTMMEIANPRLEITSMADIPAGTGLGSSGSFTVALLKALHTYRHSTIMPSTLAEEACEIEIHRLKEPVGKQDQYIASFGGITCFKFQPDESVDVWPLAISGETRCDLEENLLLFFTGFSRSASAVLKKQDDMCKGHDSQMIDNLHSTKELGFKAKDTLESGKVEEFATLMDSQFKRKLERCGDSHAEIRALYELGLTNGALGGKLVGAGGGGFLLFYALDKRKLRAAMNSKGLREIRFRFDSEGTRVVIQ
jgi:D-glycero-alpha-D-manno-heptose-7-phosphate kinase